MIWLCVHTCSGGLRPSTFFTARSKARPEYPIFRGDACYWDTRFNGTGAYSLAPYKTEAEAYAHVNDWCFRDDNGILQWRVPTVPLERAWK